MYSVGPKQLCVLAHLGCTRSRYFLVKLYFGNNCLSNSIINLVLWNYIITFMISFFMNSQKTILPQSVSNLRICQNYCEPMQNEFLNWVKRSWQVIKSYFFQRCMNKIQCTINDVPITSSQSEYNLMAIKVILAVQFPNKNQGLWRFWLLWPVE